MIKNFKDCCLQPFLNEKITQAIQINVVISSLNLSKTKMTKVEHKTFEYLDPGLFFKEVFQEIHVH